LAKGTGRGMSTERCVRPRTRGRVWRARRLEKQREGRSPMGDRG